MNWKINYLFKICISALFFITLCNTAHAKTYTRSCEAKYYATPVSGGGSEITLLSFTGKGEVSGYFPNKARRRAREKLIKCARAHWESQSSIPSECTESNQVYNYNFSSNSRLGSEILRRFSEANQWVNGTITVHVGVHFSGDRGCGGGIKIGKNGGIKLDTITTTIYAPECGNGIVDGRDTCDDGQQNSDTEPDGCRSNCMKAWCGDGVADSGEECDGDDIRASICSDFDHKPPYHRSISNDNWDSPRLTCNFDCTIDLSDCKYCGDGITQSPQEQCDDGNDANDDGCNTDCTVCVSLLDPNNEYTSNIDITNDTEICTQDYHKAYDYADPGVIIIKAPNLVLDCDGARLTGNGNGIGIYIKHVDNVTVKNCILDNYEYGIYAEDSHNIHIRGMGNDIINCTDQVVLDESTTSSSPPPPPPSPQEKTDISMSRNQFVLSTQKLKVNRVDSKTGDSLKMKARPITTRSVIAAPKANSRMNKIPTKSAPMRKVRQPRPKRSSSVKAADLLKMKAKPGKTTAPTANKRMNKVPTESTSIRKVRQSQPKRISPAKVPVITFPKSNQKFVAPARFTVKARFDKKRKVIYLLKQLPKKRIVKRSTRATFNNLAVGNYCISMTYRGEGKVFSPCVKFSVIKSKRVIAPIKRSIPQRRP